MDSGTEANHSLAHRLHDELVRECLEQGFNRLDRNYRPQEDRLLRSVVMKYREEKRKEDRDEADAIQKYGDMAQKRLELKVPKYSAKFWRKWNNDLAILEDATEKEIGELETAKREFETLKRRGKIPKRARFPVGSTAAAIRQVREIVETVNTRDRLSLSLSLSSTLRPSTSAVTTTTSLPNNDNRGSSRVGTSSGSRGETNRDRAVQSRSGKCLVRYGAELEKDVKLKFLDPDSQTKESKQLGLSDLTIHLMKCKVSGSGEAEAEEGRRTQRRSQTAAARSGGYKDSHSTLNDRNHNSNSFRGPTSAPTPTYTAAESYHPASASATKNKSIVNGNTVAMPTSLNGRGDSRDSSAEEEEKGVVAVLVVDGKEDYIVAEVVGGNNDGSSSKPVSFASSSSTAAAGQYAIVRRDNLILSAVSDTPPPEELLPLMAAACSSAAAAADSEEESSSSSASEQRSSSILDSSTGIDSKGKINKGGSSNSIFPTMPLIELPGTMATKYTKGGVWPQAEERKDFPKTLTRNCDSPPVDRIKGKPKLLTFSTAPRFSAESGSFGNERGEKGLPAALASESAGAAGGRVYSASTGVLFSRISREDDTGQVGATVGREAKENPGPGEYKLPRMFETDSMRAQNRDLPVIGIDAALGKRSGLIDLPSAIVAKMVGFGYGCKKEQHEVYGMCLDGMCGRRGRWENVMLSQNDRPRTTGRVSRNTDISSKPSTATGTAAAINHDSFEQPAPMQSLSPNKHQPFSSSSSSSSKAEHSERRYNSNRDQSMVARMVSAGGGHIELPSLSMSMSGMESDVVSPGTVDHFPMPSSVEDDAIDEAEVLLQSEQEYSRRISAGISVAYRSSVDDNTRISSGGGGAFSDVQSSRPHSHHNHSSTPARAESMVTGPIPATSSSSSHSRAATTTTIAARSGSRGLNTTSTEKVREDDETQQQQQQQQQQERSIYGRSRGGFTSIIGADEVLSPIQIATLKGDAKLIRELCAPHLNVDVNFANPESGLTALHIAAIEFQIECIVALKEAFPLVLDLQPRDVMLWDTPLHWAARKGYDDVVTMLCDIGCSTGIRNKKGKLPIEIALNYQCHRALAFAAEREALVKEYDNLHQQCESYTDLNAQRIAMGLKPLSTTGSPSISRSGTRDGNHDSIYRSPSSGSREGGFRSSRSLKYSTDAADNDKNGNDNHDDSPVEFGKAEQPRSTIDTSRSTSRGGGGLSRSNSRRQKRPPINYEEYDIEEQPVVKTIFDDPAYNRLKDKTLSSYEVGFIHEADV